MRIICENVGKGFVAAQRDALFLFFPNLYVFLELSLGNRCFKFIQKVFLDLLNSYVICYAFFCGLLGLTYNQKDKLFVWSLIQGCLHICYTLCRSAEKAMAPHSSTLAWKIPWMEEPGGLQSMGSLRVGHD